MVTISKIILNSKIFFFIITLITLINFDKVYADIFQIENVSLNQRITDHINDLEKHPLSFSYPSKKYTTIRLNKNNFNLKNYDYLNLVFEWKDKNKLIQSIYGTNNTIKNYESCLEKQNIILNEIYSSFVDDIIHVEDNQDKVTNEGTKYNSDVIELNNGNLIKIQCYDFVNNEMFKRNPRNRYSLAVGLNTKDYDKWLSNDAFITAEKHELNQFELEKFTINESLLKHLTINEIEKIKKFKMNSNPNQFTIQYFSNLKIYNELNFILNYDDKTYDIKGIRGLKYYSKFDKCIQVKNEFFNYLLDYLSNSVDRALKLPVKMQQSSKGNHKVTTDYFLFENGNEINITCDKIINSNRTIYEVGFYTKDIRGLN